MFTTNLRKVGGSVMLALPPALLDVLALRPGVAVGVRIEDGKLVIEPAPRARYTLEDLLAQSDYSGDPTPEDREWIDAPARGAEIL